VNQNVSSLDLNLLWESVQRLVRDPYSNIIASLLLFGVVVIVILMVVVTVVVLVTGRKPKPRNLEEIEALQAYLALLDADENGVVDGTSGAAGALAPSAKRPKREPIDWRRVAAWLGVVLAGFLIMGVALGATTGSSAVCTACHVATDHTEAAKAGTPDQHASVSCVRCHEPSGLLGSVTIEVPARLLHYATGWQPKGNPTPYGTVMSSACYRCHSDVAERTTVDQSRGIKMAHSHPLKAGADCRDCHTVATGVVSTLTVGHDPCLRCHDDKLISADCAYCHTKDVSAATESHVSPASLSGRPLITTPDCGSCHDEAKNCDPCHGGTRMPHSDTFMWWGHAREGVKDIWNNNGAGCGRCHTDTRRPCKKCHSFFPTPGHPSTWKHEHQQTVDAACVGCHSPKAYVYGRDFCGLCHNKPYITQ